MGDSRKITDAIRASRMYFYQDMTMDAIAHEMQISRSSVSRMISFAKARGLVQIQITDPVEHSLFLEKAITDHYRIRKAHVVPVAGNIGEAHWLDRVAQYSAKLLNTIIESNMIVGIAWGTTLSAISRFLLPKVLHNCRIVQLNGAGNTRSMGIEYASEIIVRFSQAYQARAELFPVPTFFDYAHTKKTLWQERSIQRILQLHQKADILLHSIGAVNAGVPSHVYSGGYLEERDLVELKRQHIVGDIATVFFRGDGGYENIPLNDRTSGPNLDLFKERYNICAVSGLAKVKGLHAALTGGLISEIIVDEPTAQLLVGNYVSDNSISW